MRGLPLAAVALALCLAQPVRAACKDRLQAEAGRGDEVDVIGIAWDQALREDCDPASSQFHLLWRVDRWKGRAPHPVTSEIWDASITPYIRWPVSAFHKSLSIDVGIGVHGLSHTQINVERKMSTGFQFGEFLAVSIPVANSPYDLGIRLQHVSNGGIKHPNDGITFAAVVLGRTF
jgi:lipid A 3-O-deacylase